MISLSMVPRLLSMRYRPTHIRVDSVPPKRYDIEETVDSEGPSKRGALARLGSTIEEDEDGSTQEAEQFQRYADEHLFYGAGHAMDRIASHMSGVSEVSRSGQSFVDIHLEPAGDLGSSMAVPGSPFATTFEGKSSEQIRSDSLSSATIRASQDVPDRFAVEPGLADPSLLRRASLVSDTPPRSPILDKPLPGKPAEGRYRGRKSTASSRAASPEPQGSAGRSRSASRSRLPPNFPQDGDGSGGAAAGTPPRSDHRKSASVSSTGSSSSAVIAGRTDRMTTKELPSIVTENLRAAASGITVIVDESDAGNGGKDADTAEQTVSPTAAAADERVTPTASGGAADPVRSATFKMAAGLDEECRAERPTSVNRAPSNGASAPAANGTPSLPARSTSIQGSLSPPNDGAAAGAGAATLSPGLSDKADVPQDKQSRRRRSSAANAEPIESRTRMTTLPPKQKSEEIKHRVDFEKMMMMHKELERKRNEELEERRRKKEEERRASLVRWEKEILPSWTRARKDDELRALWWRGAPPSLRGRVWALAIGNAMMLPRNLLEQAEKRIAPLGQAGGERRAIPAAVMDEIEAEIADTLPSLKLFQKATGPLYDDLVRICRAFVLIRMEQVDEMTAAGNADRSAARMRHSPDMTRSPEVGSGSGSGSDAGSAGQGAAATAVEEQDEYAQRGIQLYQRGLSTLAAILLINLPATTAFICLLNLINSKAWLKALYSLSPTHPTPGPSAASADPSPKEKGIRGFERVFETLLADQMPKVYANLLAQSVNIHGECVREWVTQLWGAWLDCDTVMRLWDVVLLDETDSLIYRISLALVQTLEARLYIPDREELSSVLRGTNRAALAIWRRDKELSGELPLQLDRSPPMPSTSLSLSRSSSSSSSSVALDKQSSGDVSSPDPSEATSTSLAAPSNGSPQSRSRSTAAARRRSSAAAAVGEIAPRDFIYEQYGIREETIFAVLEGQTWWKESTLSRLLDRELGD
ncbi:uncharacterized protein PSFLO_06153 [Pseudozyma flocculosa]|uniref:Rab-GAP TBC domain-containing protein n=1 Tax=Pseudozyma flocculosa TaxID=84751 RepID=A0A5C3FB33_9BASI|nr:uncharacterized protein PSFLO_06153 [Pseudozyma flocculosa]